MCRARIVESNHDDGVVSTEQGPKAAMEINAYACMPHPRHAPFWQQDMLLLSVTFIHMDGAILLLIVLSCSSVVSLSEVAYSPVSQGKRIGIDVPRVRWWDYSASQLLLSIRSAPPEPPSHPILDFHENCHFFTHSQRRSILLGQKYL